jgi:membrane associated rhomboid family serine protease
VVDVVEDPPSEPLLNIPAILWAMLVAIVGVHVWRLSLSEDADTWVTLALAFIPERYSATAHDIPGGTVSAWTAPLTHMAVHGDLTHLGLNAASLLAFGSVVARRLGALRFTLFTLTCGTAGAGLFLTFNVGERAPMIGASGAIAGLMAASLRLMFSVIDQAPAGMAGEVLRRAPWLIQLMDVRATLADRRIQTATGVWLLVNLLGVFGLATPAEAGVIAWEAHVGGFIAGLMLLGVFDQGPVVRAAGELAARDGPPG